MFQTRPLITNETQDILQENGSYYKCCSDKHQDIFDFLIHFSAFYINLLSVFFIYKNKYLNSRFQQITFFDCKYKFLSFWSIIFFKIHGFYHNNHLQCFEKLLLRLDSLQASKQITKCIFIKCHIKQRFFLRVLQFLKLAFEFFIILIVNFFKEFKFNINRI